MKKMIALMMVLVCGVAMGAPYFGSYHEQVHHSLHPSRNVLEDTLKAVGVAVANSEHWTGTPKQAHNLVRRTVIIEHGINVPQGTDLDVEPTQVDYRAAKLREILLNQGYSESDADALVTTFRTLQHPVE